ncbi:MAG: hypothetical protein ACYTG1_04885 [Planctomycetota bacterium]|jgi:hypothetical protein
MNPERWQRLKTLFHEIGALPAAEREAAARGRCGDDAALAEDLLALLAHDEETVPPPSPRRVDDPAPPPRLPEDDVPPFDDPDPTIVQGTG